MTTPTLRQAAQADILTRICTDRSAPLSDQERIRLLELRDALAAPESGDQACPVVAWAHDCKLPSDCDAGPYAVIHAEAKRVWQQAKPKHVEHYNVALCRQSDHLAAIAAKDAEIAALKVALAESCAGQRYEAGEPHIGPCSEVVRLRAEAAALKADAEWRPIETAPTTESNSFLILRRGIVVQASRFEGRLYPDAREACVDWDDGIEDATHWKPLPTPIVKESKT